MPRKTKEQKELENLNMPSNTVQKDAKMSSNISNKKVNSKTKNEINNFLSRYYDRYTGLYLKSKNFLDQILKLA